MIKTCKRCNQDEEHGLNKRGYVNWICKKCAREYSRTWYKKAVEAGTQNRPSLEYRREAGKKNREKKRNIVNELKESSACMDCEIFYPYCVMDFDHRDGEEKRGTINSLLKSEPFKRVLEEIAKCDLVCANCHRKRTFLRMKNMDTSE